MKGEQVFLKVIPMRVSYNFGISVNLVQVLLNSLRFLKEGSVAYRLVMPLSLLGVHSMFHSLVIILATGIWFS